jgi:hypothetical protein
MTRSSSRVATAAPPIGQPAPPRPRSCRRARGTDRRWLPHSPSHLRVDAHRVRSESAAPAALDGPPLARFHPRYLRAPDRRRPRTRTRPAQGIAAGRAMIEAARGGGVRTASRVTPASPRRCGHSPPATSDARSSSRAGVSGHPSGDARSSSRSGRQLGAMEPPACQSCSVASARVACRPLLVFAFNPDLARKRRRMRGVPRRQRPPQPLAGWPSAHKLPAPALAEAMRAAASALTFRVGVEVPTHRVGMSGRVSRRVGGSACGDRARPSCQAWLPQGRQCGSGSRPRRGR